MPTRTDTYFRGLAADAVAGAGIAEPPVDVELVAQSLGVPIRRISLPGFFRGAAINEDGMPVVVLNAAYPGSRQREALAHLLGHVLVVMDGGSYPRNSTFEHAEADAIGHELILPAEMVKSQSRLWFNDYRYLSRLFAVDEGAMLERMRELGIIKGPRGISWDY